MAKADFSRVIEELDALESEIDPVRLAVDEGEEVFGRAPTAREAVYRHLEEAVRHTLGAAQALIAEADWDEPENELDAIEILVQEEVLPRRVGADIVELAEFASEDGGEEPWESDGLYDRMSQGAETLAEFLERLHEFLREWGE